MRHLLIAAAALAVGGLVASTVARAEVLFYPGGPNRVGAVCQIQTDGENFYGYVAPCPAAPAKAKRAAMRAYDQAPAPGGSAFYAGGPTRVGTMCQIQTDGENFFGYLAPCAK